MSISHIPFKVRIAIGLGLVGLWLIWALVLSGTGSNNSPDVDELMKQREAEFYQQQAEIQAQYQQQ